MDTLTIKKTEDEQRLVFGEVYAPNRPDAHGDFMTEDEIRKAAYKFMKAMRLDQIDTQHNNQTTPGVQIVESFIARKDDPLFIPGSWVIGVHIPDDEIWQQVKKGELNGFSLEALALAEDQEVELDVPPVVSGMTSKAEDHEHRFYVAYDQQTGRFMGGQTDMVNGHSHTIRSGSVTDPHEGHTHRFSSVDNVTINR